MVYLCRYDLWKGIRKVQSFLLNAWHFLCFFLIGGVYLLDVNQIAINLKAIFAKGSRYVFFFFFDLLEADMLHYGKLLPCLLSPNQCCSVTNHHLFSFILCQHIQIALWFRLHANSPSFVMTYWCLAPPTSVGVHAKERACLALCRIWPTPKTCICK